MNAYSHGKKIAADMMRDHNVESAWAAIESTIPVTIKRNLAARMAFLAGFVSALAMMKTGADIVDLAKQADAAKDATVDEALKELNADLLKDLKDLSERN